MDLSSELVHSLLPVFLVSTLGASVMTVGLIEGVAEAATLIAKVFSGASSDYFRRRKGLILLGYGMAALTKPLFPLATSAEAVFIARFLDRIGKGIRGAPRDALVADVAPPAIRGACFGLRQSMDTVGAFLGPSLAILMMFLFANDIRQVLWFAVVPAFITVFLIVFGIEDPEGMSAGHRFRSPIRLNALKQFSCDYWRVVAVGAIFTLARFSEAFLGTARPACGVCDRMGAVGDDRDEPCLFVFGLSGWNSLGSCESPELAGGGHCASHHGRFGPRLDWLSFRHPLWRGLVGAAHGLHARYPCRHDRRGDTARIEGDRLWTVQFGKRPVHAFSQCHCGRTVG